MNKMILYAAPKTCWLLLLVTFSQLLPVTSMGQRKKDRFFAEVSLGANIPAGRFADKTFTDAFKEEEQNGMAKTGIAANVTLGYTIRKKLNLLLTLIQTHNRQDNQSLKTFWTRPTGIAAGANVENDNWNIFSAMAGGEFTLSVKGLSQLTIFTRLTAGYCKTTAPGYSGNAYLADGSPISGFRVEKFPLDWTFCYRAGAGIRYHLRKKYYLVVDAAYFDSAPEKEITFNPNGILQGPFVTLNRKYELNSVQVVAGMGIRF